MSRVQDLANAELLSHAKHMAKEEPACWRTFGATGLRLAVDD